MELYRRHLSDCPYRSKGSGWNRCKCPVWCDGIIEGQRLRRSMRTTSWSVAEAKIGQVLRATPEQKRALIAPSIAQAVEAYIADLEHRRRSADTVVGYASQLASFTEFCASATLGDIDDGLIRQYLDSKTGRIEDRIAIGTMRKEVAVLRAFFNFCGGRKWMDVNPAKLVHKPAAPRFVTKPFDRAEVNRILEFVRGMRGKRGVETRALVYTLLYTGFRISDISQLKRGAYSPRTGYLTMPWTQKTGAPVRLRLHADAVRALGELPEAGDTFFHLNGLTKRGSRVRILRRRLDYVGHQLSIRANPHRFRDTFAVELLTGGADLRTVQHLLGHDSIKTTERHYAHFVAEHQNLLDRATSALQFGQDAPRAFIVNARND